MDIISTDIIERCKSGDRDAFRIVVKAYHRMLFSLSLKMLCDEEDAKDVVQESFIKIWQSIDMFRNGNNFTTWVYTITTRLCNLPVAQYTDCHKTVCIQFDKNSTRQDVYEYYMERKSQQLKGSFGIIKNLSYKNS